MPSLDTMDTSLQRGLYIGYFIGMLGLLRSSRISGLHLMSPRSREQRMQHAVRQVRAHVEKQIGLIAEGKAEKEDVVLHTLDQFAQKFRYFVTRIARMDALFEASFSPLASSGDFRLKYIFAIDIYI